MDDLIEQIQEKTGLSADKVLEVVTMVTDFFKENLPADLVNQITATLSKGATTAGGRASGAVGSGTSGAARVAGTVAGAAGSALSKALDAASGLLPDPKDGSGKG